MKISVAFTVFGVSCLLAGCVVDVTEQNTERWAYAGATGVLRANFDATIYHQAFSVQGSAKDSLIADGIFSLWAPGSSTASSIAQNVNMYWSVDTFHTAQLYAYAEGADQELLSIDRMSVTIPQQVNLSVNASSSDVSIQGMGGDINVTGTSSNITFNTGGRITLQTQSGNISGTSGLGGSALSTSGNITITVPRNFESVSVTDSTGNVSLHIGGGVGVTFQLATGHGNISLNYDGVTMNSLSAIRVTANGGGRVVNVATATGNINVSN